MGEPAKISPKEMIIMLSSENTIWSWDKDGRVKLLGAQQVLASGVLPKPSLDKDKEYNVIFHVGQDPGQASSTYTFRYELSNGDTKPRCATAEYDVVVGPFTPIVDFEYINVYLYNMDEATKNGLIISGVSIAEA